MPIDLIKIVALSKCKMATTNTTEFWKFVNMFVPVPWNGNGENLKSINCHDCGIILKNHTSLYEKYYTKLRVSQLTVYKLTDYYIDMCCMEKHYQKLSPNSPNYCSMCKLILMDR